MKVKQEHDLDILLCYGFKQLEGENNAYLFEADITYLDGYVCYLDVKADTRELSFRVDRVHWGDGVFITLPDVIKKLFDDGIIE